MNREENPWICTDADQEQYGRKLKEENKDYKYVPLQNIRGKFECFKQINII